MMRKLVIFLAAAIMICMPLAANALGFGSLKLNSSLNEPLNADIELLSATSADISSLSIKLASPDAFLRAGIDRPALLSELKFAIQERKDGSYYINVTSRSPVREPFLNFLLEMNWQNGRMLREYTMLLDPPTQVRKQPSVVEAAPTTAPAAVVQEEAAEPSETPFVGMPVEAEVSEAPAVVEMPVAEAEAPMPAVPVLGEEGQVIEPAAEEVVVAEPVAEEAAVVEAAPEAEAPVAETAVVAATVPVLSEEGQVVEPVPTDVPVLSEEGTAVEAAPVTDPQLDIFADDGELLPRIPLVAYGQEAPAEEMAYQPSGALDYGIVRKGDNLWTIAEKLRPDESISIYQVMMALLQSNPEAFVDGNVNRLKVGHVLRIEDASLLTAMSQKEAALEYQSQTQAWEDYRQQVAAAPATQPIIASEVETGEVAEAEPSGELTLASPEGTELQAGSGVSEEAVSNDIVTLQDELRQVRNDAGLMRNRNAELNTKLQELEQELSRLQRSLTIKDDELAALQQQLSEIQQQTGEAAEMPAPVEAEQEVTPVAEPPQEAAATIAEPVTEEPAPVAEQTPEAAPAASVAETAEPEPVAKPAKPIPPPPVAAAPKPVQPQAEEGIMDTVMGVIKSVGDTLSGMFGNMVGDSLLIFIALPVLLVLVILMLILVRRRRKSGQAYQESILTGGPASVTGADAVAEESEEESSFLSDFAVSGAGAIQTQDSEVDPLTEADVFMAYGRYEAAEERLAEAIKNEPGRPELKLKLLELYHATKNKPSFENTAEDFYASLGDGANSNPMWQKVVSMGAELVPGNPLFSGGRRGADLPDLAVSQDPGVSLSDSQVMDIGLDTGVFDAADIGTSSKPADAGSMDFNLDLGESTSTAEPAGGMDFSLDMGESAAEEDKGSLDFSLDMDESAEEEPTGSMDFSLDMAESTSASAASEDSGSLDFDLDMGSDESSSPDTAEMSLDFAMEEQASEDDTMSFDLGQGLDEGTQSMPEPTMDDMALESAESEDFDMGGDEVGTKLDLAKAYIDMGDPDGARSILDEVMAEGDASQKQEAQALLDQIV